MNTFIYALCEPGTQTIRYIGKSDNPKKRLGEHTHPRKKIRTHLTNWVSKVLSECQVPSLLILKEVPGNEWEWWERSYIQNARMLGFNLVNMAEGGEGFESGEKHPNFGKPVSEDQRRIRAERSRGNKNNVGKKRTDESRKKSSRSHLGKRHSLETRTKMSLSHLRDKNHFFGKHHSEETKRKISETKKKAKDQNGLW